MAQRSTLRDWGETALVRSLLAIRSPHAAQMAAQAMDRLVPKLRRAALRNLAMAMPELDAPATVDGVFRSVGRLLHSVACFPEIHKSNVHQWIRYQGFEHFEAAKRRGKGVLFATAHLGNWELSAYAHALMAEPMNVVVRPLDNPRLDALAEQYRSASGNRILGKKEFLRPILRALAANEAVGILVDQNSTLDRGIFVNFFGIPACVDSSFARLAAHSGATVIPGYAVWSETERKYVLHFDPPVPIEGDLQADSQAIHCAIERAVRAYPDQWLWIHRRWKTRPPGESSLY